MRLGNCKTDGIRKTLPERPGRDLDARSEMRLRMTRRDAAELAEFLQIVHRDAVAGEVEKRVEQHRRMARAQNIPVAVEPGRILGIEAQMFGPERVRRCRSAQRHAGMPGICFLYGVYRKKSNRVDTLIVIARVRHGVSFEKDGRRPMKRLESIRLYPLRLGQVARFAYLSG